MRKEKGILTKVNDNDILLLKADPDKFWEDVDVVGYECFANCKTLTTIPIPEKITIIGPFAFSRCENLVKVDLLTLGLQSIGMGMFSGCKKLKEVIIHKDIKTNKKFLGCKCNVKIKYLEIADDCEYGLE